MSSTNSTVYLITGANRGMGLALTKLLLARPRTTVIAAVRNPASFPSSLTLGQDSKILPVAFDATDDRSARNVVEELHTKHRIKKLDVVVANAGIAPSAAYGDVKDINPDILREHIGVNEIAPLLLFQAVHPLLTKSTAPDGPKFLLLGTKQGSIGGMESYHLPMAIYGASKAIAYYFIRKIHIEHEKEGIVAWVVDPGFVQTDTGNEGAHAFGMAEAPVKMEDSLNFILNQIDNATRGTTGGTFPSYDGGEIIL